MPHDEENMESDEVLEVKDTTTNVDEEENKSESEKTYTQEDIDRVVSQEKARLERKYRKEQESKLGQAQELENTIRVGLGLSSDDDVLSKVKDFYKEQGIDIPDAKTSVSNRDSEILGKADANEIIDTCDYEEIEARANELAVKQKQGKTSARESAEFFKLGEYLTTKLEEKELKANGVDIGILQDREFKKFASRFNRDAKISEVYELWEKLNEKTPKKPVSTGSSKSTVPDNGVKDHYTSEEVDKLTDKELDDPNIWKRVRESMKRW